ncbi:peptide chain release factor N(5)-glutamine methyltransferase [Anaplasma bovis]|uniref:peptide chain release factor N(5)-glutamine methyltransferase n=1 Tax=Anaplasma bovis TaxID=186733 RepID=UPI002FF2CF09
MGVRVVLVVKVAVLLGEATSVLNRVGVETAALDSRLIICHVLQMTELEVLTNLDLCIDDAKVKDFFRLVTMRLSGVPMSHILCRREFWSMDFSVSSDVLDPRPDTETIISTVIGLHANSNKRLVIADLGTGSGCIIVALLSHYKNAYGVAFEKSVKAYRVARENVIRHGMMSRIKLHCMSWDRCYGKFDVIVSNPPYIKRCKIRELQYEVRMHEPTQALDGGIRGMEKYLQIFKVLNRCLKSGGSAVLEIGEDQDTIRKEAIAHGLRFCGYSRDFAGRKRCVVLQRMDKGH